MSRILDARIDRMYAGLLQNLSQGGSLLEIGCAPGWILARLGRLRPDLSLHGIDYAPTGVEETRAYLAKAGVRATVSLQDMRDFKSTGGFSGVLSAGLVEHYDDPVFIVRNHARIAGSGHHVIVTVPNFASPLSRTLFKMMDPDTFATHNLSVMCPPALGAILRAAGLARVSSGYAGGCRLYVPGRGGSAARQAARILALAWNGAFSLLPSAIQPWNAFVWAIGTVPGGDDDAADAVLQPANAHREPRTQHRHSSALKD
jgi:SAM-dependent methyltransferase